MQLGLYYLQNYANYFGISVDILVEHNILICECKLVNARHGDKLVQTFNIKQICWYVLTENGF